MMDHENKYGTLNNQKTLLHMMKDIHQICITNKIRYSLCGGSLLGAIRENGFIQWDDDMDIMVPRKVLDLLITLINKSDKYDVVKELWVNRIRRIEDADNPKAPTIDIFVIDNVPDNYIVWKIKVLIIKILQGMLKDKLDNKNFSFFYRIALLFTFYLGKLFSRETKLKLYDKVSAIGNKHISKSVSSYNDLYKCLDLKYDGKLMRQLQLHKFENTSFLITNKYDNYLKTQYGDYLTPPDEKDRIPIHL